MKLLKMVILSSCLGVAISANAASKTNGALTLDIREDNGAIETVTFGGTDWFNPGTPVSDWGFDIGGINFTTMNTSGSGLSATVVDLGTSIRSTSSFSSIAGDFNIIRDYSLVSGFDAFTVSTQFVNTGSTTLDLRTFDTFDPDPGTNLGSGPRTFMDVATIDGFDVALSSITAPTSLATALWGNYDVTASGEPFEIDSSSDLSGVFASPFDANGAFTDRGMHTASAFTLEIGESAAFSYTMGFGTDYADATSALSLGPVTSPVPEPQTYAMFLAGLGLLSFASRKKQA